MSTNPYETPRAASRGRAARGPASVSWLMPGLMMLAVSYAIGSVLTPADPFSSLLGALPVFAALIVTRWLGVRAGRREAEQRMALERGEETSF